jgi:hypothetical protein
MLNGFVKLAGKSSPAQLAHKAGLLCKEVCGATQASCFLTQEDEGLSSWSKLSDGKAEVFSFSFFLSFFSCLVRGPGCLMARRRSVTFLKSTLQLVPFSTFSKVP